MDHKNIDHTEAGHCCSCEGCGWGMGRGLRRHGPLRTLIIILGAMLIFWCGFKIGLIKGFIMAQYEDMNWMHRQWETRADDIHMRPSMMQTVPAGSGAVPAANQ